MRSGAAPEKRKQWSLASRLAVVTSVLLVVTCVVQGALLVHRHLTQVREYLADRARSVAARLAEDSELGVLSGDDEGLRFIAQQALYRSDVAWVRIADAEGKLLASAGTPKSEPLPRIRGADRLVGPIAIDTRFWEFQAPVKTVANPPQREEMQLLDPADPPLGMSRREHRRIGTVAVGLSLAPLQRLQREAVTTATGLSSLVMLLAIASATWFARAITRPLKDLASATKAIAQGNLHVHVDEEGRDEIGALAQSFNTMADSIAEKQAALESYSRTLEEKVQARTQHLEELNRELQEASRLKSEFLGTVSHELRTPLNVILGYTEMLSEGSEGALTDAQRELVGAIDRYSRLQLSLITSVLDFSRLSSGKVSFHVERFMLALLIEEVAALIRTRMHNENVRLDVRVSTLAIELETDRVKLQEVLRNLLENAIKFTEQGSVTVAGRRDPEHDRVIIEIRDTGCGIPPEELARVFDPFRQVGESSTRSTGGVGLGLSIVKQLVTALGGEIAVRSTVGEGSVFEVGIPRRLTADELQSVA